MTDDTRQPILPAEVWPEDAGEDEGVVLEWFVDEGSSVDEDEPVCEIQVEKANVDVHAPVAGVIDEICFQRDEEFDRDEILGYVDSGGE